MTSRSSGPPHFAPLDGLRGIAILAVFCAHYGGGRQFHSRLLQIIGDVMATGWFGVDLFFVLSGFLITGILLRSLDDPHYFRTFYIRRTLRIFPIYYGVLVALLLASLLFHF
ncbi:MAG: acyltransferase, partial [Acidobacteriaceae bacterium]